MAYQLNKKVPAILDKISRDSNYVVFLIICDFRVPSKQQCCLLKFGKNSLYTRPSLFAGVERGVLHV